MLTFMGRAFSRDDVLRLAPDAGSAKSGQDLAQVRKWVTLAGDESVIWGQCQGSGSKPYQTQIDLAEPAFKCSCPSRKFPCKHGLGLLLIYASSPDAVIAAERPAWVNEWMSSRQARAAKAAEKETREPQQRDPEAQAKRRKKRIDNAREGIASLSAWMRDLVRNGIGAVPGKGFDFFDSQARRMVDAQAPGVARMVRELGSLSAQGAGWQRPFVEQLSQLHLLSRAVERFDELPEPSRADVESVLGVTTAADELKTLPAISDRWQVVSQEVELDDRLRVQRTWLYGAQTQRAALVLQFAHGAAGFDATISPGTQGEAELVFFPGNGSRAAVRTASTKSEPLAAFEGCASFDELLDRYSRSLAEYPWLDRLCLPLRNVVPTKTDDTFWLIDQTSAALPVQIKDNAGFTLLAIAGGKPVDVAGEFDGQSLAPMSVIAGGRWTSLARTIAETDV
jgi:hypothetical protein